MEERYGYRTVRYLINIVYLGILHPVYNKDFQLKCLGDLKFRVLKRVNLYVSMGLHVLLQTAGIMNMCLSELKTTFLVPGHYFKEVTQ